VRWTCLRFGCMTNLQKGYGSRRAGSVEPLREKGRRVRLSGTSLCLKRLVSSQIVLWMPCQTALSRRRASAACLATLLSVFVDRKLKFGVVSSAQRGRTRNEFHLPLASLSL